MEFDVGTDEVTDRVGQGRVQGRCILPEDRVVVVHAGQPAQARLLGGVALVEVPHRVRFGDAAAAIDYLVGGSAQALDPAVGQEPLEQQIAILEVELALLL